VIDPVGTEGPALDEDSGSKDEEDCSPEEDGFVDEEDAFEASDVPDDEEARLPAADDSGLDEEESSLITGSVIVGLESPQPAKVNGKAALKVNKLAILRNFIHDSPFQNKIYKNIAKKTDSVMFHAPHFLMRLHQMHPATARR
jgi:hypothetical protein